MRLAATIQAAFLERRLPNGSEDSAVFEEVGEVRARQGVPASSFLPAIRFGVSEVMRIAADAAPSSPHRDSVLLEMMELLNAWSDFGMIACATGHRRAELELMQRTQQLQDDLVRGLLHGSSWSSELGAGVEAYGLDPGRGYHAFRARTDSDADSLRIERYLHIAPSAERREGLVAVIDGDLCGFVATLPSAPPPIPLAIGVSAAVPLQELSSVFRLATRALETAIVLGRVGIVELDTVGIHAAVLADRDIGEMLEERYLRPVERLSGSGPAILETVARYLANDRRLAVTAEELYLHINTVRYRLARFEEITRSSLRESETLVGVWWALSWQQMHSPRA
jgi:hypothetical protein